MQARRLPAQGLGAARLGRCAICGRTLARQALGQLGLRLARRGQRGQVVAALGQNGFDEAVHQQIGVAPDRAGEVGVGLESQPEVAAVVRGVDGLLHRAQQHLVDLRRVRALLGGGGKLLKIFGLRLLRQGLRHAQRLEVLAQGFELFGRGALVHPVQPPLLALGDELGRAHIGRQHGLFDQLVRLVAHARHDAFDAPAFVANDLRLDGLEIHRTTALARRQQRPINLVQVQQVRHQGGALLRLRAAGALQNRRHFGVGQAGVAEHHGREELVGVHLALGVDEHVAHQAQALDLRVERAQAIGELFRQHRNHAARKIDRGGAIVGLDIERAAVLHVVAHIGNRYQQPPALAAPNACGLAIHRVVEVARVLAVYRYQRDVGEVDAAFVVGGTHLLGQAARLCQRGLAELVRHRVLAHRDLDFHAGVVDFAQHLFDAPNRLPKQRRWLGELNDYHLSRLRRPGGPLGDEHVLAVAFVFRGQQPDPAFVQQAADQGGAGAFDDFGYAPLGAAAPVVPNDARLDAVAVQHGAHFVGREVEVGLAVVALHKAVAVAVPMHHAVKLGQQWVLNFFFHSVFSLVLIMLY